MPRTSVTDPPPHRRRLTAAERRARILDAASRLFAEEGFGGASVERIARGAGVSAPVVYDHFPSKHELFVAVMESARDELTARGTQVMSADAPAEARVRAGIDAFFTYVEDQPAAARVLLVTHRGTPELNKAARLVQAEARVRMTALLAGEPELLPGAPDRDRRLELFAEFLMQGMHGLAEWWAEHADVPRNVLVDSVMDVAWVGLRGNFRPEPGVAGR
jgi:AcrR family transcriptional regulator